MYRVGYPSGGPEKRTYQGYLAKVAHELDAEQVDHLATITPYATGATIKDLVNESLSSLCAIIARSSPGPMSEGQARQERRPV